ncbi:MAG: hypothetical protein HY369_01355 [Candidatus Aenigmarchaeota archaeon]|nr:hypothetical protein [Candidatus Aenigmarchaeota archaeon]
MRTSLSWLLIALLTFLPAAPAIAGDPSEPTDPPSELALPYDGVWEVTIKATMKVPGFTQVLHDKHTEKVWITDPTFDTMSFMTFTTFSIFPDTPQMSLVISPTTWRTGTDFSLGWNSTGLRGWATKVNKDGVVLTFKAVGSTMNTSIVPWGVVKLTLTGKRIDLGSETGK